MRTLIFAFSLIVVLSVNPAAQAATTRTLNNVMTEIGSAMVECFPLILARHELSSPEKEHVSVCVSRLNTLFHEAGPFIQKKSEAYQISYRFVTEHLENTDDAISSGDFDHVRFRLRTLGTICTSCHTQDTKLRTLFAGTTREQFDDDVSFADFNYFTRNYQQAEEYYDRYLKSDVEKTELELVKPLQRFVTIYAQIYNRPGDGAKVLKKYEALSNHTDTTRVSLQGWVEGLTQLDVAGAEKIKNIDFSTLEDYVIKYLVTSKIMPAIIYSTPEEEVKRVWLRGQLFHYLNRNPRAEEIPKILYWLSICDRAIGYDFDFSLADYYLKHCVLSHPGDPYARRCYQEYKQYITFFNNGVKETELPIEVHRDLERLREALEPPKKSRKRM